MTIKNKLFAIVFGEFVIFLLAVGLIILFIIPVLEINRETEDLRLLGEKVLLVRAEMNRLFTAPLEQQFEEVNDAKSQMDEVFNIVSSQRRLSNLNAKVNRSMDAVIQLQQLFEERWERYVDIMPIVMDDAERTLFSKMVSLKTFYTSTIIKRNDDYFEIMERALDLESSVDICNGALSSAYEVIDKQFEVIETEVAGKTVSVIIRSVIIFILIVIGIIIAAAIMAGRMAKSVTQLESGVAELRHGNLLRKFTAVTKDEIGTLGRNLNSFSGELRESIEKIKESSEKNIAMKDELIGAAISSTASTTQIATVMNEIKDGMGSLDSQVKDSGQGMGTVKSKVSEVRTMLEEQFAMIEESTSAVTQMIASIDNVADITGKKKNATDELVKTANIGGEKLNETIGIIQEITSNIDEIRTTVSIIQSVAAQTGLLAMNAAIEAAHAGEYGAGFAVVAEEIRKLSDASGQSSKRISAVIKSVIENIEKAASAGEDTKGSFVDINREVVGVARALDEISGSMDELSIGGKQILDAMTSLRSTASNVENGGREMEEASSQLEVAYSMVERVTRDVISRMSGITQGINEIKSSVEIVSDISSRLSDEADTLNSQISRFKTEGCPEDFDNPEEITDDYCDTPESAGTLSADSLADKDAGASEPDNSEVIS